MANVTDKIRLFFVLKVMYSCLFLVCVGFHVFGVNNTSSIVDFTMLLALEKFSSMSMSCFFEKWTKFCITVLVIHVVLSVIASTFHKP